MFKITADLRGVPDDDLLRALAELLSQSRRLEWRLVAHIGEVAERKLYAREGCASMFVYCTDVLHLSEYEAYLRIAAGQAAREHPVLLEMLADGRLHLSGIGKLASHLTVDNRDAVLARATHKTKKQIEVLVAELAPRPDVPASIRKLPERSAGATVTVAADAAAASTAAAVASAESGRHGAGSMAMIASPASPALAAQLGLDQVDGVSAPLPPPPPSPSPRPAVEPLSPGRYKVQFTATAALYEQDRTADRGARVVGAGRRSRTRSRDRGHRSPATA